MTDEETQPADPDYEAIWYAAYAAAFATHVIQMSERQATLPTRPYES